MGETGCIIHPEAELLFRCELFETRHMVTVLPTYGGGTAIGRTFLFQKGGMQGNRDGSPASSIHI